MIMDCIYTHMLAVPSPPNRARYAQQGTVHRPRTDSRKLPGLHELQPISYGRMGTLKSQTDNRGHGC